ncbi:MAG: 3-alpha,7-alpha,12-alpha-trihydroxy-5-beta-cholest-24-enoyl-CoA hydratase [Gammaproteobacteria bacterium]|nr:3-alpha,7-alpha,12-alpha-trihydroxy-5-beta-cholest-24-enoyl-CoA hydratase [Gammaproteobacteria bacterium]MBT5202428.1 3-alpha,7-alpha,12-alpha-trihydroxy-5-beta-cholest-24-enoyl-CoA hydratase [Gammaproteobacteria bacterium]
MIQDSLSNTLIGIEFPAIDISWNEQDTMLYALGVGAKPGQELDFLYEGRGPLVLPTYAVIPGMQSLGNLRNAVKLKIQRLLHGEQKVEVLRPLPAKATVILKSRISEVWDKGKNGVIGVTAEAEDADGLLFRTHATLFYFGGGGFGGDPGPSGKDSDAPPDREADIIICDQTQEEQGALYRLSGDRVALHIDPGFAEKAGYDKPFMHGLCTYGFVGRAILSGLCDGNPERFKSMSGRFAARAEFEDQIITKIWKTAPGEAIIQAENQQGTILLSQGQARFETSAPS